MRGATELFE